MSDEQDDWMGNDLEEAADEAAAEAPVVDWEALGAIEREAMALAAAGKLSDADVDRLIASARRKVPAERSDVVSALDRDIRALI